MEQTDHQKRVEEFMKKAGQNIPDKPTLPNRETRFLRARLIYEEAMETIEALGFDIQIPLDSTKVEFVDNGQENLVKIIDGCLDTSVVVRGCMSACGVKDKELLEEVDNNNLAKFGPGHSLREDGKLIKPPDHKPPRIRDLLKSQGLRCGCNCHCS